LKNYAKKILVKKPQGKRPLGRPKHRWEDNIKVDLKGIGLEMWTGFIWLRIGFSGGLCEHGDEPSGFIKGREFLD
jgi:hypothetical protein